MICTIVFLEQGAVHRQKRYIITSASMNKLASFMNNNNIKINIKQVFLLYQPGNLVRL